MDAVAELPYRLQRRPSPWGVVLQRAAFTIFWNGFFSVFVFVIWPERAKTPIFIQAILGFFVLCGLGMIWDVVVRIARTAEGKTAVIEVDKQPARRGDTLNVRVYQKDLASLNALVLALAGDQTVTETRGSTTIMRTSRCCNQEIFRYMGDDLAESTLDRNYAVAIPADGPSGSIRWSIVVGQELKQGGVDMQSFPLEVEE